MPTYLGVIPTSCHADFFSPTAPPKRPLVSRLPPPPPKRSRRESTAEDLPSYEDAALPEDPSREDVKPIVRRPPTRLPPRNLSSTASASPAPPPSRLFSQPRASASTSPAPPASPQAFVRIRRLPPWITETLLTHWLTYGALIFDKCADPAVASSMVAKGYYRRMPRVPPPKPLSVELVKGEAHGGEPEGFGAVQRMALVGYASEEDAWRVKKGFDTMRVLPASLGDEMVEVTLG